jgi:hypothetical protein
MSKNDDERQGPVEIALVGDLTESEDGWTDKLLGIEPGGECVLYFDSLGGSPYAAVALMSLILLRGLKATGVVAGECSSAALWPFAACRRRLVTPVSVLLFHPMKWQSEENVALTEAAEWARHFGHLEADMDQLLVDLLLAGQAADGAAGKGDSPIFAARKSGQSPVARKLGQSPRVAVAPESAESPLAETVRGWIRAGRYVTGRELAETGLAELVELKPLDVLRR